MKNIIYLLMLSALLAACKSNTKQKTVDSIPSVAAAEKPRSLADEFKGITNGHWVKSDYIDEIAKTRSPYKAWEKVGSITGLFIDADSIKGDSGKIGVNYSYHEGDMLTLKFRKGHLPSTVPFYSPMGDIDDRTFELGYKIANRDTSLIVYTYNSKGKLEDKASFTKLIVNGETTGNYTADASYYRINQLVIAGNYEMADTLNSRTKVVFKSNGTVKGLDAFKKYSLAIDFMAPPNEADEIYFDITAKGRSTDYIYQFDKDTLKLYEPKFDRDSIQLVVGKLKYKLVKQK